MSELEAVRREIEKIDREILSLIDRRIELAGKVLESKKISGAPILDPGQNHVVIDRAVKAATELNLDPGSIKAIFETLIIMSIERQEELSGRSKFP